MKRILLDLFIIGCIAMMVVAVWAVVTDAKEKVHNIQTSVEQKVDYEIHTIESMFI